MKRQKCYWVYIIASLSGTLYTGLTDDLKKRLREHRLGLADGFTKRYKVHRLMYYELFSNDETAAAREKQIKKFRREKKIALFSKSNPHWEDLTAKVSPSWKDILM
ncbi:MAG TPA: GIY-YIG nuclease family protein [Candidatus Angelobacter sp.]|nr:GIY-YIG nuclease family protein [Candidatus Angelobacter sp.]